MKRFYQAVRSLILGGLMGILCLSSGHTPVQAEVACTATIPVTAGTDNNLNLGVQLAGNSLVWWKQTGELFHYNLVTTITTQIGSLKLDSWWENFHAVDGDHVAWIDPANQIQLYTVSSATTQQLTNDTRLKTDVRVEGNYVLWRQGKNADKLNKLFAYNMTAATSTKIGKTFGYSLSEGRVLWGQNLYDLATASTTTLPEAYFAILDGSHALGTLYIDNPTNPGFGADQLMLKDLGTGTVTQITDNPFRTFIDGFTIDGDYLGWSEYYGLGIEHRFFLYQISTGEIYELTPVGEGSSVGYMTIDGRFTGFAHYPFDPYSFYVYDSVSTSSTRMLDGVHTHAALGAIDDGRIAWIAYNLDNVDEYIDMQVLLRTGCGATPTIVEQTPSLNILTGRSVDLKVTVLGDQPMTYQWYQGEVGDTTTPLSTSLSYTTPPITQTTSYWFKATNAFGATETETITLTPGSTAELVMNGSFEEAAGAFLADWTGFALYQDCDATAAHTGSCAARVNEDATPGKVTQSLSLAFPYLTGDTLTLSAWIKADQIAFADAGVLLKVRYADDTKAKIVLKPTQTQFDYTQFTSEPLSITGVISKAKVIIKYNNPNGDWWIDDVSLLHQPASAAAIPLPPSGLAGSK